MDHKRDSKSQRIKNLQYKSRGRGRSHGPADPPKAPGNVEEEIVGDEIERVGKNRTGASDRLGSNWDRYVEPGESDGVGSGDALVVEGAAKKQSEGLDYSTLLEEADALISGGSVALLTQIHLDSEDFFQTNDFEEKPLPLDINLNALNESLSFLSMAERLGLEEELFLLSEETEAKAASTSEGQSSDSRATSGDKPVPRLPSSLLGKPGSMSMFSGGKVQAQTVHSKASVGRGNPAMNDDRGQRGQAPLAGTSVSFEFDLEQSDPSVPGNTQGGTESNVQVLELSTSARGEEEDAALLAMLLGTGGKPGEEVNAAAPWQSESARPAPERRALPDTDRESASLQRLAGALSSETPGQRTSLTPQPGSGDSASVQAGSGPSQGARTDFPGNGGHRNGAQGGGTFGPAERVIEGAAPEGRQQAAASPPEDNLDALLAVLTPSSSNADAQQPAIRPASKEGLILAGGRGVPGAGPSSREAVPFTGQPEAGSSRASTHLKPESKRLFEKGGPATVLTGSKTTSVPADQDFDAWLDSIS